MAVEAHKLRVAALCHSHGRLPSLAMLPAGTLDEMRELGLCLYTWMLLQRQLAVPQQQALLLPATTTPITAPPLPSSFSSSTALIASTHQAHHEPHSPNLPATHQHPPVDLLQQQQPPKQQALLLPAATTTPITAPPIPSSSSSSPSASSSTALIASTHQAHHEPHYSPNLPVTHQHPPDLLQPAAAHQLQQDLRERQRKLMQRAAAELVTQKQQGQSRSNSMAVWVEHAAALVEAGTELPLHYVGLTEQEGGAM